MKPPPDNHNSKWLKYFIDNIHNDRSQLGLFKDIWRKLDTKNRKKVEKDIHKLMKSVLCNQRKEDMWDK